MGGNCGVRLLPRVYWGTGLREFRNAAISRPHGVPSRSARVMFTAANLEELLLHAIHANGARYGNLAKTLLARFYAKLLIPRLGT